jgi:hypothetical protein
MRIEVINKELQTFGKNLKAKGINYDMVVAVDNDEKVGINIDDVELIPENKYEKIIINHIDMLKIKLEKEVSPALYIALLNCIEERIGGRLENIELLNDSYKINKRGTWEKKLVLVVNDSIPLDVNIVGQKYAEEFSITFKDISLGQFIDGCKENIAHLENEIAERANTIERYKKNLQKLLTAGIDGKSAKIKKLAANG